MTPLEVRVPPDVATPVDALGKEAGSRRPLVSVIEHVIRDRVRVAPAEPVGDVSNASSSTESPGETTLAGSSATATSKGRCVKVRRVRESMARITSVGSSAATTKRCATPRRMARCRVAVLTWAISSVEEPSKKSAKRRGTDRCRGPRAVAAPRSESWGGSLTNGARSVPLVCADVRATCWTQPLYLAQGF